MPDLDLNLAIAVGAILLGGFSRGFTGFGAALIIVPALVIAYGPVPAVVIMSLMEVPGVAQLLPTAIREADWKAMKPLCIAAVVTLPFGAWTLAATDPDLMRRGIALMVVAFGLLIASGWRYKGAVTSAHSAVAGALGGFCSGAANLGGPPVVTYLLAKGSNAAETRAGIMGYFSVAMVLRLSAYGVYGLYDWATFWRGLALAPVYVFAIWVGSRFFKGASETLFRRVIVTLVLTMGVIALVK